MSDQTLEVRPGNKVGHVESLSGELMPIPEGWSLLPPGDAALSRRIKKDGPSWTIKQPKGRKLFSLGILAPSHRIAALRAELVGEREDPSYQRKLDAGRKRREAEQAVYVQEFAFAVRQFLKFAPRYDDLADLLADKVTAHAVPVGSGTVARTKRIPVEQRAESAVIAWMRHQTTAYDDMTIPREKGKRREVRRMLAQRSRVLLDRYRRGEDVDFERCPLHRALAK